MNLLQPVFQLVLLVFEFVLNFVFDHLSVYTYMYSYTYRCERKQRGIRKEPHGDVAPRPPISMLCIVCVGEKGCREINEGKFQRRRISYTSTLKVGHGVSVSHVHIACTSLVFSLAPESHVVLHIHV